MNKRDNNILGTIELSYELEKLITESSDFLIIVSPYLKITDRLKGKLAICFNQINHCFFVYRNNELQSSEKIWMSSFENVHLIEVKNLHAKIYINEKRCLLTSMNLYEYSQINNHEIGIEIDSKREKKSYLEILEQILLITNLNDPQNKISITLEPYLGLTVGSLFNKVQSISNKYQSYSGTLDGNYIKFCNDLKKLMIFKDSELYHDKTAILRTTFLGKEKFDKLFRQIK